MSVSAIVSSYGLVIPCLLQLLFLSDSYVFLLYSLNADNFADIVCWLTCAIYNSFDTYVIHHVCRLFFNTFDSYVNSLVLFIVGKRSQVLPTDGKELVKMLQGRYSKIRLAVFFGRFDSKGTPDVRTLEETQEHSAQLTDWFVAYYAESRSWVRGRKHICGCAPPYLRPTRVHLTSHTWWMKPGLPRFSRPSASVYYTERKPKNKKWGRPGNEAKYHTHYQFGGYDNDCYWVSILRQFNSEMLHIVESKLW